MWPVAAVAAVHDGYVLKHSITQSCIGGAALSQCMLKSLEAKGISVKPRFAFRREDSKTSPGQFEVSLATCLPCGLQSLA